MSLYALKLSFIIVEMYKIFKCLAEVKIYYRTLSIESNNSQIAFKLKKKPIGNLYVENRDDFKANDSDF